MIHSSLGCCATWKVTVSFSVSDRDDHESFVSRIALVPTVWCRVVCLLFFQCGGSCKPAVFSRFAMQFCDRHCEESGGRAETIKFPRTCFLRVSVCCMRTGRSARDGHFKRVGTNDFDKATSFRYCNRKQHVRHGADGMSNSW